MLVINSSLQTKHVSLGAFICLFTTKGLETILLSSVLANHLLGLIIYNNNQNLREWGNTRKKSKLIPPLNVCIIKWSFLEMGCLVEDHTSLVKRV